MVDKGVPVGDGGGRWSGDDVIAMTYMSAEDEEGKTTTNTSAEYGRR